MNLDHDKSRNPRRIASLTAAGSKQTCSLAKLRLMYSVTECSLNTNSAVTPARSASSTIDIDSRKSAWSSLEINRIGFSHADVSLAVAYSSAWFPAWKFLLCAAEGHCNLGIGVHKSKPEKNQDSRLLLDASKANPLTRSNVELGSGITSR